jgi:hypothetical protein
VTTITPNHNVVARAHVDLKGGWLTESQLEVGGRRDVIERGRRIGLV